MTAGEDNHLDWRRGGAAAVALIATLVLLGMLVLVSMSNTARDRAVDDERHAFDVTLLTRTVDSSLSRSEAALGRFVLDEDVRGSGNIYLAQWRLAEQQVQQLERLLARDPAQSARVDELKLLFRERGRQFAEAARSAGSKQKDYGIRYYYAAGEAETGPFLRAKLAEIAAAERTALTARMQETQFFAAKADRLTDYQSWLGMIVGVFAIFMGYVAFQA
ncbi:MAG: hypothetical protein ABIP07_07485, partial [Sphingomicrobium sp.]